MFFKPYQVEALHVLWKHGPEGANSKTVWDEVNEKEQISRASVINSLSAMVDEGILGYTEKTGKGGHHRVYRLDLTESELKQHLAKVFIDKLLAEYPMETRNVLKQHK
jgi:predicted transcriptional regulator